MPDIKPAFNSRSKVTSQTIITSSSGSDIQPSKSGSNSRSGGSETESDREQDGAEHTKMRKNGTLSLNPPFIGKLFGDVFHFVFCDDCAIFDKAKLTMTQSSARDLTLGFRGPNIMVRVLTRPKINGISVT